MKFGEWIKMTSEYTDNLACAIGTENVEKTAVVLIVLHATTYTREARVGRDCERVRQMGEFLCHGR